MNNNIKLIYTDNKLDLNSYKNATFEFKFNFFINKILLFI